LQLCVFSVGYILNITREIDNFFPGVFEYCNVRIYDMEDSDLLKHWPRTFDFISKARLFVGFLLCNYEAAVMLLYQIKIVGAAAGETFGLRRFAL